MRLHEFSNPLKNYLATVHVVLRDGGTTARTMITSDIATNAKKLLTAIVRMSNVLSLSYIICAPSGRSVATSCSVVHDAITSKYLTDHMAKL